MFAESLKINVGSLKWETVIANVTDQEACDKAADVLNAAEAEGYHLFKATITHPEDREGWGIFMAVFLLSPNYRNIQRLPFKLYTFEPLQKYDPLLEKRAALVRRTPFPPDGVVTHILRRG